LKRTTIAKVSHIRGQLVGAILELSPENENQKTYASVISKNAGSYMPVRYHLTEKWTSIASAYCLLSTAVRTSSSEGGEHVYIDKQSGLTKNEDIIDPDVRPDHNVESQQKAKHDRDEESYVYLQQR
jgi:hypothetical protein